MKNLICLALTALLWNFGAFADAPTCAPGAPRVDAAFAKLSEAWTRGKELTLGWRLANGVNPREQRARSHFEVYSDMASLMYRFGIPTYDALTTLQESGRIGEALEAGFSFESDARLAEVAILRQITPYKLFRFVQKLEAKVNETPLRSFDWGKSALVRVTATAVVFARDLSVAGLDLEAEHVLEVMGLTDALEGVPGWFTKDNDAYLWMIVEAALLTQEDPGVVVRRLDEIHAAIEKVGSERAKGKRPNEAFDLAPFDPYLLVRASLAVNASASKVAEAYAAVVNAAETNGDRWETRDYAKVTAAVIVSGRPDPAIGGEALKEVWKNHHSIFDWRIDWENGDYSAVAAAALLGPKGSCPTSIRYW